MAPRAGCFYNHTKEKRTARFFGSLVVLAERSTVNQTGVTVAVRTCLEPANSSAATSSSCLNNETGTDAPGLELQVSFQQLVEVAENPTPTTEPVSPSLHRDF